MQALAPLARYVVEIGDCAGWGGISATPPNPTDSTGLQFHKTRAGGFLGRSFRAKAGQPVINVSGCPAHPGCSVALRAFSKAKIRRPA